MTNKETVQRNIGLTFDFVEHLIENPELHTDLPDNFRLSFVEKDFTLKTHAGEDNKSNIEEKYVKVRNTFEISKA